MSNNYIDVIEEIKNRLENAITTGQPLEGVERVRVGAKEDARNLNDYPIINIDIADGEEVANSMQRLFYCDLSIEISLIINKIDSDSNVLYDTTDESGPMYVLTKLLNVLDKKTDGTVNLNFSNTAYKLRIIGWVKENFKDLVEFVVTVSVATKEFTSGGR